MCIHLGRTQGSSQMWTLRRGVLDARPPPVPLLSPVPEQQRTHLCASRVQRRPSPFSMRDCCYVLRFTEGRCETSAVLAVTGVAARSVAGRPHAPCLSRGCQPHHCRSRGLRGARTRTDAGSERRTTTPAGHPRWAATAVLQRSTAWRTRTSTWEAQHTSRAKPNTPPS